MTDEATGSPVSYRIEVDLDGQGVDTTLEDIVTAINTDVAGVNASITPDHRLSLNADAGFAFTFGNDGDSFREDSSKLLAARASTRSFKVPPLMTSPFVKNSKTIRVFLRLPRSTTSATETMPGVCRR
ncbi:MAG: flagellin hook IN motif-containing protein [Phycisphaerae bacterium]